MSRPGRWASAVRYEVPELLRLSGGSSQATIADAIAELVGEAHAERADRVSTVVSISVASGLPFVQTLSRFAVNGKRAIRAAAVMVGDAVKPRADDRLWQVPARELLAITLGLLAESRIEVAELEHAATLGSQLEAFRTRPAPRDALADWRPAPHTDLTQAMMLAACRSGCCARPSSSRRHHASRSSRPGRRRLTS